MVRCCCWVSICRGRILVVLLGEQSPAVAQSRLVEGRNLLVVQSRLGSLVEERLYSVSVLSRRRNVRERRTSARESWGWSTPWKAWKSWWRAANTGCWALA
jgi:hypothetical protein